jgi:hypothetical protein
LALAGRRLSDGLYASQIKMKNSIKQMKVKDESMITGLRATYYDVKYRLRSMIPYKIRFKWNELCCWINPRNQWATDVIPNHWSDKTYLIPEFMFAAIIHFVDGEKALETTVWQKKKEKELLEVYAWAKTGRKEFQDKIDKAYPEIPKNTDSLDWMNSRKETFEELYGEVNRLEAELEKIDTKHLTWIVKNRQILWS